MGEGEGKYEACWRMLKGMLDTQGKNLSELETTLERLSEWGEGYRDCLMMAEVYMGFVEQLMELKASGGDSVGSV